MSLFMVFGTSVCHVWSALLGCECLCVFCFSHHSLFNKAEVRCDVILQKVNIQSEFKQHNSRVAANVPSLCIKIFALAFFFFFFFFFSVYSYLHVGQGFLKLGFRDPQGATRGCQTLRKQLKGKINIMYNSVEVKMCTNEIT